jgi:hypothetical protein
MTFRTVRPATFDSYLDVEYPVAAPGSAGARALEEEERQAVLRRFPYSLVLELAYPELDFANRWCWKRFGPSDGECLQASSEYRACDVTGPHSHEGQWYTRWLVKTAYDFGYNEWFFSSHADRDQFLDFVPQICWGERYPK